MFELNGKQYSVDDLQNAAVKYGMDYNTYLSKMMEKGLKEIKPAKTEAVTTETAPVTAENQAVSTDLVSENGSSDSQKPKPDYASQIKSSEFFKENVPYKGSEQEEIDKKEDKKDSSVTINDLLKTLDGVNYKKESGKFETDDSVGVDVFQKEEEQAVPIFSEMFKGSGINFKETSTVGLNPFTGMPNVNLDAMTVSIGEKGSSSYKAIDIPLEVEGGVARENLTKLKNFIKENKDKVNTYDWSRNNRQAEKAYDTWKDSNVSIEQGEQVIKQETLKNPNYFDIIDKANEPKTSAEKYASARTMYAQGVGVTYSKLQAIDALQQKLNEAKAIISKKSPKISSAELDEAARNVVRQQDYQQRLAELEEKEIQAAIKRGEISASVMYVGGVASKSKKTEKFNKDLDVTNIIINQTRVTNNDTEFLFENIKKAYREDGDGLVISPANQGRVLSIAKKLGVDLDMSDKSQVQLKNGNIISSNYYKIMQASRDASTAGSLLINNRLKEQSDLASAIGDDDLALIAAGKNYNMWDQAANSVLLGAGDLLVGAGRLTAEINPFTLVERIEDAVSGNFESAFSPKFAKLGADWVEFSNKDRETYARSVSFDDAFKSGGAFMQFALQETATQIPIIAAIVASGGTAAPWVIGASTMGSKMNELGYENINLADGEKYSNSDIWLKSLGYGALEGSLSAVSGTRVLRNAKTRFISGGKQAAETLLENSAKTWAIEQGKGLGADVIVEAGAEALTTGGQNLIDGKPFTENMAHAAFSGFGMSTLMGGVPYFRGLYYSSMSNYAALSDIRGIQSDIDALSKRWATAQTESGAKIYAEAIADKYTKLNDAVVKQESLINNNLTSGGANKIVEITSKLAALQNKAKAISESKDLSTEEKNAQIKPLLADFNSLKSLKDKALGHSSLLKNETEFKAFQALQPLKYDQYVDQATQELIGERNGKEPNNIDVDNRAYDLYFGDIVRAENAKLGRKNSSVFKSFKSFETVDEAIADLDNVKDLSPEDKAEIILGLKNGNDGYANKSTGTQVAVVENQVANQRKYTKVHEVGHKAFWNLLGNNENNAAFKQVSEQILSTLKKTDKKVHDSLLKDGVDDDSGNIIPAEVISRFLEYVSEGKVTNVQKAKGISGLFGVMVQKQFSKDYNFDFRGEQDIYNFVVGIGKKIKDGSLTMADIKKAKKGDLIKSVTKDSGETVSKESSTSFSSLSNLKAELKEIDEFDYDNEFEFEQAVSSLKSRISRLEKQEKPTIKEEVVTKPKDKKAKESTEEIIKKASDKVFEDTEVSDRNKGISKTNEDIANEMLELGANSVSDIKDPAKRKAIVDKLGKNNLGAVTNLTKKAAAVSKNLVVDENLKIGYDEFFSGFSEELSALIKSYKVEVDGKKIPFGAYMNQNLPRRYGQILEKALKGRIEGAKSLDINSGEKGFAGNIAAEESADFDAIDSADKGLPAGELIDVTDFRNVKDKVEDIKESIDLTGVDVADLTYRKIQNDYSGDVGAEIIGLWDKNAKPKKGQDKNDFQKLAERIEGTRTLNYGKDTGGEAEVRAMQKLFLDYSDVVKFIKTMPEFNVAPFETTIDKQGKSVLLTEDAKGYSVGTANKTLKKFYDVYIDPKSKSSDKAIKNTSITSPSGKGKGKTSQVAKVYRLKPEYRGRISIQAVQDLQKTIGITPAGEAFIPMKKEKRTEFGTVLQGLTKMYATNVANTVIRKKIVDEGITSKTKSAEKVLADIGGGKSSVMFSKNVDGFDPTYNIAFSQVVNIDINKTYGDEKNWYSLDVMADDWPETEARFLSDYEKFIKKTKINGFRPNFFISSKNTLNPNSKKGDPFFKEAHKRREATRAKIAAINKRNKVNRIGFNSPPNIFGKTVDAILNNLGNKKIKKANTKYGKVFDETWKKISEIAREDPAMIPFFLHFLETAGDTSHFHRLGAKFIAYDKDPERVVRHFVKDGKKVSYDIYFEYEHAVQSHIAAKILLNAAFDKRVDFATVLRDIKENYKLVALSVKDAKKLNKAGYALKMPKGWEHWWQRYFNEEVAAIDDGINPESLAGIDEDFNELLQKGLKRDGSSFSKSLNLDKEFNDIIENKTGIESYKNYKKVKAQVTGASKGKFNFFIAPSAEDFVGLLYKTLGKGKIGDAQMAWYKENLLDPYARAMEKVSRDRNFMARNFLAIKKELKIVPKNLKKKIPGEPFTQEQAIRVYIWNKKGSTIPEISENDSIYLTNFVENNEKLKTFADQVIALSGIEDYAKPGESWVTGTITTDMLEALNTTKRKKY